MSECYLCGSSVVCPKCHFCLDCEGVEPKPKKPNIYVSRDEFLKDPDTHSKLANDTQIVVVLGKNGKPAMWMGGTL